MTMVVGRNTAHHVVSGRNHWNWVFDWIHASKVNRNFTNARQFFHDFVGAQVIHFEQYVVFVFTATTAFVDFHCHCTRNHVTRSQVFYCGCITLHEAFAIAVEQNTTLTAHTFSNQHARTCHTCWVELPEFHVFQRNACTRRHTQAITCIHKGIGRRSINTATTTSSKQHCFGMQDEHFTCFHFQSSHTNHVTVFITDQVQCHPFHKELGMGTNVLLVQSVQHGVTCTVGHSTSAFNRAFTMLSSVTTEWTLVDFAAFYAVKRHTHVFQFDHGFWCSTGHEFDGILVAQPVRTFYGIVHVPIPTVFLHIAQRG